MSLTLRVVQLVFTFGVVGGLGLAGVLWHSREKRGAQWLAIAVIAGVWYIALQLGVTAELALLEGVSIRFIYAILALWSVSLLLFGLEYTGRTQVVSVPVVAAAGLFPAVFLGWALLAPGSDSMLQLDPGQVVSDERDLGVAVWINAAVGLFAGLIVVALLFEQLVRTKRALYSGQAATLAVGLLAVFVFNGVSMLFPPVVDPTALGFMAFFASVAIGYTRYDLVDIKPVAHERIIDAIRDGVLVVDSDGRILESNPAADELFDSRESLIGRRIDGVLADRPELQSVYGRLTETETKDSERIASGDAHLTVEADPITDQSGRVSWLLLIQDETEQVHRERALERQIDRLDQFAKIVSHDLRNPITIARGFTKRARESGDVSYLERVSRAIDRMDEIVENVLALARAGHEVTDPTPTPLASLVEDAWANVATEEATLSLTAATEEGTILADPRHARRLLENLVRNSVEHGASEAGAADITVTVDVEQQELGTVTVRFADDGPGIPPAKRDAIFEDDYTTGGTGLGLAIVEEIATAHGWTVSVGESEDGGALFTLEGVGVPLNEDESGPP